MIANPPLHLLAAFQQAYPEQHPAHIVQAPGRDTWVAATPADDLYMIFAHNHEAKTCFSARSAKFKKTLMQRPLPSWSRYAAGVIVTLENAGMDVPGVRIVTLSEDTRFEPRHDHALGMAVAALWYDLCGQLYTSETILELVERVRRQYVEG